MNLNQVTIPSTDLQRSIKYYQTLGLELIVHSPPRYARFLCPEGGATFSIHLSDHLQEGEGPVIYFECQDVDAKIAQLQEAGIKIDQMPIDQVWLWRESHLTDPDGNKLIIYHAGINRVDPPWRLGSKT